MKIQNFINGSKAQFLSQFDFSKAYEQSEFNEIASKIPNWYNDLKEPVSTLEMLFSRGVVEAKYFVEAGPKPINPVGVDRQFNPEFFWENDRQNYIRENWTNKFKATAAEWKEFALYSRKNSFDGLFDYNQFGREALKVGALAAVVVGGVTAIGALAAPAAGTLAGSSGLLSSSQAAAVGSIGLESTASAGLIGGLGSTSTLVGGVTSIGAIDQAINLGKPYLESILIKEADKQISNLLIQPKKTIEPMKKTTLLKDEVENKNDYIFYAILGFLGVGVLGLI